MMEAFDEDHLLQVKKRNMDKEIVVLKLTRGNYFGDEGGFESQIKHYHVKVTTNTAQFFVISKRVSILF